MTWTIKVRGDSSSFIVLEFECPLHGRFSENVPRTQRSDASTCPHCGGESPWVMSAPTGRVKIGEVTRGKSDERPPGALDTRALADGMPYSEWKAKELKRNVDLRRTANRKRLA